MEKLNIEWKQDGNKVYFDYKGKEIYFIMPDDYKLSETHKDLLKLAEWLMFSPWYDVLDGHLFTRKGGKNIGLSFSAGVDSTAAAILLPEAKLVYAERDGIESRIYKQDNALRMIENMDRGVIRVKTNFELIRTMHGLNVGFSTAVGMGVPIVLMGDYLDLGVISYGKVFDDQYFPKGVFRKYTKDYMDRQRLLQSAGLIGFYPTVGCSEVITTKLVDESEYKDLAYSCIRGEAGEQCNKCFKCFRKNLLRDKKAELDSESMSSMRKNPPKMAPSLSYAIQKNSNGLEEFWPINHLFGIDVKMLEKAFPEAYEIYSPKLKELAQNRLREHGIEFMGMDEINKLKKLNFLRDEEETPGLMLP